MKVAVMQPYFYPYGGYFRLIAAVDLFILFDCVQFPRRGRVHRTEVPDGAGGRRWLTLPLAKQPQTTRIDHLAFAPGARGEFDARLAGIPALCGSPPQGVEGIAAALGGPMDDPAGFVIANIAATARALGIATPFARSSDFTIGEEVRQAERIAAIAVQAGATTYVNASGGRGLYEADFFAGRGLALEFMAPYDGPFFTLLADLWTHPLEAIAADAARAVTEPA